MSIELKDKLVTLESLGVVYDSEVNERTEAIANEVTARNAAIVEAINQAETGAPTKVELVSQMTNPDKNYLYIGEEQGYNSGHIYYLVDGAPVDKGVFGGTNIDDTLTISGQAADAKVTGDKIEEIKEDLSTKVDFSKLANMYLEFTPEYRTVEGYYKRSGDKMVLGTATAAINSVVVTNKIYCKPGFIYSYTGKSNGYAPGVFYFLGESCVSTLSGNGTNKEYIVPDGVDAVVFQGYAPSGETPNLTVELVSPALLSDIRGEIGGETGQIWTKTADGAVWSSKIRIELTALRNVATFNKSSIGYSLYEGGGHYNKGGKLAFLSQSTINSYLTDLIPCYTGQQFLYQGRVYGGTAYFGIYFLDEDGETIISTEATGNPVYKIVTVPSGASYVRFQSTWSVNSTPFLYVEDYDLVKKTRQLMPLDGLKLTVFGDSISMPSVGFVSYLDMLVNDGVEVTNLARSGTGISVGYRSDTNYYGRFDSIPADVQMIIISGSFNDLNRGPALGTIDDTELTTIAGYMNQLFSALIENFPTVPMLIITTNPWVDYRPGNSKSDDYVDMLRQMGIKYGIPFYSLYDKTNLRPWIDACKTKFFRNNGDGVHPNTEGFRQIYALLKPVLVQMCYQTVIAEVPGKNKGT